MRPNPLDIEPELLTCSDVAVFLDDCGQERMAAIVRKLVESDRQNFLKVRESTQRINAMVDELASLKGCELRREPASYKSEWE